MEKFQSIMQGFASGIIPTIILLGLLIFIHELGHFLVAKFYKVRVEVFSLGFGPKLVKFIRGDTTYALSAIPLGGYVKMYGDDPTQEVPEEMRDRAFLHKPVGQRIAIVLAGPLMNLFFAALLFGMIAVVGEKTPAPRIGDIPNDSKAFQAGFRSGDRIQSFDGKSIDRLDRFKERLEQVPEKTVEVRVKRDLTGEVVDLNFKTEKVESQDLLSMEKFVGGMPGLSYAAAPTYVGIDDPNSVAGQAGLQTGDMIKSVNGIDVNEWREFSRLVLQSAPGSTISLVVTRREGLLTVPTQDLSKLPEKEVEINFELPPLKVQEARELISGDLGRENDFKKEGPASVDLLAELGVHRSETFVLAISPDSPAAKAGLKPGDRITTVDDVEVKRFEDLVQGVSQYETGKPAVEIEVKREGKPLALSMTPMLATPDKHRGSYKPRYVIGVTPIQDFALPEMIVWRASGPLEVLNIGLFQAWDWSKKTVITFVKLFNAEVSPRNIGGFISIGQMASRSWDIGLDYFLRIMAIISINLFILNLLPIPILDGGHLVFFSIEAIKGAPISMRKMEIAQQVGLVLLLSLMAFALFNDFSRVLDF